MRIAVIVPEFPTITQTFTYTRLGALGRKGIQIHLFFSKIGKPILMDQTLIKNMLKENVKFSVLPTNRLSLGCFLSDLIRNLRIIMPFVIGYFLRGISKLKLRKVLQYLLRFAPVIFYNPDVIHIETSYLVMGMLEGFELLNKPIVISLRGADVDEKPQQSDKWRRFYLEANQHPKVYFHCVSKYIQTKALELGVEKSQTEVIHLGISESQNKLLPTNLSNYIIQKLVTIARLSYEKGVDIAIRSLAILNNDGYNFVLEVIGGGPEENNLRELVHNLKLQKNVVFYGEKTNDWVRDFLQSQSQESIYIQPSRYEAFPTSLLEAQLFGCLIIAANLGGIPENIIDGGNGLLFTSQDPASLAEKILYLVNHPEIHLRLRRNAYQSVRERFSSEIEADKFVSFYKRLAESKNQKKP